MSASAEIRLAVDADAPAMLAIYAPIVRETAISFELEPPTLAEFRRRVANTLAKTAWLVCEIDGEVAGYAYASALRPRAAYQWSVEVTVYAHPERRRLGVGRALYAALFGCLRLQGFRSAYAAISLPNAASVALHESIGFTPIGVYRGVGYKLGAWRDVGWWRMELNPLDPHPTPPTPLPKLRGSADLAARIAAGLAELKPVSPAQRR